MFQEPLFRKEDQISVGQPQKDGGVFFAEVRLLLQGFFHPKRLSLKQQNAALRRTYSGMEKVTEAFDDVERTQQIFQQSVVELAEQHLDAQGKLREIIRKLPPADDRNEKTSGSDEIHEMVASMDVRAEALAMHKMDRVGDASRVLDQLEADFEQYQQEISAASDVVIQHLNAGLLEANRIIQQHEGLLAHSILKP